MKKSARFVIWICSEFTRQEIEEIIQGLLDVLANHNPLIKPKDDFKEKYPNYRNFFVDPNPPLKTPSKIPQKLDWRKLLPTYEEKDYSSLFKIYNSLNTLCRPKYYSHCKKKNRMIDEGTVEVIKKLLSLTSDNLNYRTIFTFYFISIRNNSDSVEQSLGIFSKQ